MNKRLLLILFFVPFFLSSQSFKHMLYDNQYSLKDIELAAKDYFEIHGTEEGSGYKGYQRWLWENAYKYPLNGERSEIDPFFTAKEWSRIQSTMPKAKTSATWQDLGPYTIDSISGHYSPGLGRVECFYVDPSDTNRLYLGSRSGGFWRSLDGGATWSNSTTDFLVASGVNTMTVKPGQSDTVLINVRNAGNGTSHGLYRSVDGGLTWAQTPFIPNNLNWGGLGDNSQVYKIAYHPTIDNKVYVGTSKGLYISNDDLQTWSVVRANNDVSQIVFHPTNDSVVYIYDNYYFTTTPNKILVSRDAGASFLASDALGTNGNAINVQISVSPACPDCVYAADRNGVWKSTDLGDNFTFRTNPPGVCDGFSVHDADTSTMIYGMLDIFGSSDGGSTFNQITNWFINGNFPYNGPQYVHADLREIACINGTFYIGTDGFLCKSYDKGQTWHKLSQDNGIRENYDIGVSQSDQRFTMAGSQDNGTSIFRGDHWLEFYGADGMEAIIHPLNPDWMMGSVQTGIRRVTRDGGYTQNAATPANQSGSWEAPLLNSPLDHFKVIHLGDQVYESLDFGVSWTTLGSPLFSGTISRAAIAPNNDQIIAVSRGDDLEISINGGSTFRRRSTGLPTGFSITEIDFHPFNDSILLVTYGSHQNNGAKVYQSNDLGVTWQNITGNLGNMPILSAVIGPDEKIYLGAEIGVYVKDMNATNWFLYNPGLPNMRVNDLEINWATNTLRAATWGRGMWEISLQGRDSYPKMTKIEINDPPTLIQPMAQVDQFVSADITYTGTLSSVFLRCSVDSLSLDSIIPLQLGWNQKWESTHPLPNQAEGSIVYFKVYAVGSAGDTTESFRFNYRLRPFEYCGASGGSNTTSDYITYVALSNLSNTSGKDGYGDFTNQYANLQHSSTYSILVRLAYAFSNDTAYAWIDYNKNRVFENSELITFSPYDAAHEALGTFTVPYTVGTDTTRLRIRSRYVFNDGSAEPCDTFAGEVEDYSVIITGSGIGLAEKLPANWRVYPNPAKKVLHIEKPEGQRISTLKIKDISGKVVFTGDDQSISRQELEIEFLAKGLYYLYIETSKQSLVQPFIKD